MKTVVSIILSLLLVYFQNSFSRDKVLEVGEELNYKVYYGFIKLGEVSFKVTDSYNENNKTIMNAIARIKSYEGIPLVNVNFIFETKFINVNNDVYSIRFFSTEFKNKTLIRTEYKFDYDKNIIFVKKEINDRVDKDLSIPLSDVKKFQDGLSIFYHARLQSFANKNFINPVFINEEQSSVRYSFNINKDVISTDIADYDISVIKIAGVADFEGIFGLTGEFVGWLSDDDARIPIKAQFNVTIGSISLELSSYNRKNWKPPVFTK